ncbi:MAG: nicotinate (nicotinamide) nucleotide adenylyltransferase [Phycisphaerae bacterium]
MPVPPESNPPPLATAPAEGPLVIFGGSFDPVHLGHTAMLTAAMAAVGSARAVVVPAYQSPHKPEHPAAAAHHRLAMLRLALADAPGVSICEDEIKSGRAVYTYDTLQTIRAANPARRMALLIGMDQLSALHRWHRGADIVRQVQVLMVPRAGSANAANESAVWREVQRHWPPEALERLRAGRLAVVVPGISSTDIRSRIESGRPIAGLVHPAVEQYILMNRLYNAGSY